jgi:glycosyltransferase involved in cell wall biosynthesis
MLQNILIAASAPPDLGSGINTYSKEISMEFRRRGIGVVFASPKPQNFSWFQEWGISHFSIEPDEDQVAAADRLLNHVRNVGIQAAINNDNSVLQSIAPAISCPIIAIGHLDSTAIAKVACFNSRWIDHVVAISNDMHCHYVHKLGINKNKCPIIHNGLQDPGPAVISAFDGERKLRAIVAGEYSHRKGGDLVKKMILTRHPVWSHVTLDWFGRVPEGQRRLLVDYSAVKIHGRVPRDQFLGSLGSADVFLIASRREGCPMAMIEAMGFGVVPITSDGLGAMRGLVTDGQDGYICSLKDWPHQVLNCLQNIVKNPESFQDMKSRTRNRFLSELTTTKVVDKLLGLLQSPTVDRRYPQNRVRILKWHRLPSVGPRPSIMERLYFKFGIIRYAGWLNVNTP